MDSSMGTIMVLVRAINNMVIITMVDSKEIMEETKHMYTSVTAMEMARSTPTINLTEISVR